jgi:hypothetical protein
LKIVRYKPVNTESARQVGYQLAGPWPLDRGAVRRAGFFDTAQVYINSTSELALGRLAAAK